MRDSGRVIQCQTLAGLPWEPSGHRNRPGPLYGALMLADDSDEPVAVVCYLKRPVEVPGLTIADVQSARHGTQRVTYVPVGAVDA